MDRIITWEQYLTNARKYFPQAKIGIDSLNEPLWFNAKESEAQYNIWKIMGANQLAYPTSYAKFLKLWNEEGRWYQEWLISAICARTFFLTEYFKDVNQEIMNSIKLNSYSIGGYSQTASPMSPQNYENLKNTYWTMDPLTESFLKKLDFLTSSLDYPTHSLNYWYNLYDSPTYGTLYDINITGDSYFDITKTARDNHFIDFVIKFKESYLAEKFASKLWVDSEISSVIENLKNNVIIPIQDEIDSLVIFDSKKLDKDWAGPVGSPQSKIEADIKVNPIDPATLNIHKIKVSSDGSKQKDEYDVNLHVNGGLNLAYQNVGNTLDVTLHSLNSSGTYYGTYKTNTEFETWLNGSHPVLENGDYVLISDFTDQQGVIAPAQLTYNTVNPNPNPDSRYPNWDEWILPAGAAGIKSITSSDQSIDVNGPDANLNVDLKAKRISTTDTLVQEWTTNLDTLKYSDCISLSEANTHYLVIDDGIHDYKVKLFVNADGTFNQYSCSTGTVVENIRTSDVGQSGITQVGPGFMDLYNWIYDNLLDVYGWRTRDGSRNGSKNVQTWKCSFTIGSYYGDDDDNISLGFNINDAEIEADNGNCLHLIGSGYLHKHQRFESGSGAAGEMRIYPDNSKVGWYAEVWYMQVENATWNRMTFNQNNFNSGGDGTNARCAMYKKMDNVRTVCGINYSQWDWTTPNYDDKIYEIESFVPISGDSYILKGIDSLIRIYRKNGDNAYPSPTENLIHKVQKWKRATL